jgi:hypothetical protein
MRDGIKTGNIQELFQRFGGGGGGGQRAAGPPRFQERPGESTGPARGAAAQGEGQQAEEGGEAAMPGQSQMQEILRALRPPGSRGGGRFSMSYGTYNPTRRGAGPLMTTGDYLVTLKVGDQTFQQVLRVERTAGTEDTGFAFEEGER